MYFKLRLIPTAVATMLVAGADKAALRQAWDDAQAAADADVAAALRALHPSFKCCC